MPNTNNKIIVKLNGGLGNQMFQYAFAHAVSKSGCDVLLDMSFFDKKYARPYELNVFDIQPKFVEDFSTKLKLNLIWRFRKNIGKKFLGVNIYREPHFHYDENVNKIAPNTFCEGFFQSEKYIDGVDFRFKNKPNEQNRAVIEKINSTNSVSLHIRRGDYVQKKRYNDQYAHCSLEYYKNGVEEIAKQFQNPTLFVFSDDIEWVKENLKLPYETVYISHNTGADSYEDMRLMSLCRHNVIANSSFSWWGAYLNQNKEKIVIAPIKWFNDDKINQEDVIPESWRRL